MEPDDETWNRWKNDPDKWFWGVFYYNREDPRLLVPKRNELLGATLNFAHRGIASVLLIPIVFVISMALLIHFFAPQPH